jgi:hypothetical protein
MPVAILAARFDPMAVVLEATAASQDNLKSTIVGQDEDDDYRLRGAFSCRNTSQLRPHLAVLTSRPS